MKILSLLVLAMSITACNKRTLDSKKIDMNPLKVAEAQSNGLTVLEAEKVLKGTFFKVGTTDTYGRSTLAFDFLDTLATCDPADATEADDAVQFLDNGDVLKANVKLKPTTGPVCVTAAATNNFDLRTVEAKGVITDTTDPTKKETVTITNQNTIEIK